MITIKNASIADILPEWLAGDTEIQCLSYAINMELKRLLDSADKTNMFANIENASGDILDALAMEMDTPYYDNDLPIETKRELVEKTSPWHAKAGTTSAVEDLVATVFGEGNVEEWYEYNDVPYYFKIITNAQMVPDMVDEFNQMIKKAKNARSHLRTVEVRRTVEHPEYFVSGISATPHITITNNPQLARSIGEHTTQGMAAYATPHVSA